MKHIIGPQDTKSGNFGNFTYMLIEAIRLAEAELKLGFVILNPHHYCTKNGKGFGPFDGILFRDAKEKGPFFLGIYHDTENVLVFNEERDKRYSPYAFNLAKAATLASPPPDTYYKAVKHVPGMVKPTPKNIWTNMVAFRVDLFSPSSGRQPFYDIACGDCQCEWIAAFVRKARTDIEQFRIPGGKASSISPPSLLPSQSS